MRVDFPIRNFGAAAASNVVVALQRILPGGSREEAGVFTLKDMEELNLDGCTLERAEVAFLDEDGPSPDLPHRVTLPRD